MCHPECCRACMYHDTIPWNESYQGNPCHKEGYLIDCSSLLVAPYTALGHQLDFRTWLARNSNKGNLTLPPHGTSTSSIVWLRLSSLSLLVMSLR
jgi:hypothetical protein